MQKKKISSLTIFLIVQILILAIMTSAITTKVSTATRNNSLDHMKTITDERAQIIDSYVRSAERTLSAYARAGQITDLLKDPTNKELQKAAQSYTELFSNDIPELEGIYVSEWNTHVLAHTSIAAVGITTRENPESRTQLQNAMLDAGNGVYNTGIIISPASYKQIVSMYKAVYDSETGEPIGLVGMGVFTEGLIKTLDNLDILGIDEDMTSYSMVNTADKKYIFNREKALISTEVTNDKLRTLCEDLHGTFATQKDYFEYEEQGTRYISTYTYMKNYGWILTLDVPKNEVLKLTTQMRVFFLVFSVILLGLILMFYLLTQRQEATNRKLSSQISKTEKTKQSLTTAMFKDILTDVGNRVSFTMDIGKLEPPENMSYYFIMFNVSEFSEINSRYGNDAGDQTLLSTVQILKKNFLNSSIYRTGSDEFIVVTQEADSTAGFGNIINTINIAHAALLSVNDIDVGSIQAEYKIAAAKKSSGFSSSIISTLKDMTNRTGVAVFGQVQYVDLDLQNRD